MNILKTEIAVIGSGPGGSATACTLAEGGRSVLLLEEGANASAESCTPFSVGEMERKYRNGGLTIAVGSPKIPYIEASTVGGGSEVNAALYHRTPSYILENWRNKFNVESLSEKDLQPHFEECERAVTLSFAETAVP